LISWVIGNRPYFSLALAESAMKINIDEKLHEDPVFDSGGGDLHDSVRNRQASRMQKERQELPNERQQGMHLREGVRLQGSK